MVVSKVSSVVESKTSSVESCGSVWGSVTESSSLSEYGLLSGKWFGNIPQYDIIARQEKFFAQREKIVFYFIVNLA